jgi:hypothetical protein
MFANLATSARLQLHLDANYLDQFISCPEFTKLPENRQATRDGWRA